VAAWAKEADTNHNLYYCANNPQTAKNWLKKSRKFGIETNSQSGDALSIDTESKEPVNWFEPFAGTKSRRNQLTTDSKDPICILATM